MCVRVRVKYVYLLYRYIHIILPQLLHLHTRGKNLMVLPQVLPHPNVLPHNDLIIVEIIFPKSPIFFADKSVFFGCLDNFSGSFLLNAILTLTKFQNQFGS